MKDRLNGPRLRLALVSDQLTRSGLEPECELMDVTPDNYVEVFRVFKPDLLFFESVWNGHLDTWKFKVASYPWFRFRSNRAVARLTQYARDLGVPTVFWNKEDSVHFERFIESAALFDIVLTVDENCLPRYRGRLGAGVKLGVLPFAVQPAIHHPLPLLTSLRRANFIGSYSRHIHSKRREWQDLMFAATQPLGLTVYDRNSGRKAEHYRYPDLPWLEVRNCVPHDQTADIYRQHIVSLNVNTVSDSPTMFSRRLVEIVACGGLAVTNPSPSVDRFFGDYVTTVHDREECYELMQRLSKDGLTRADRDRALAGADYVVKHHTWRHRLQQIAELASG